ncbi:hypothetical protein Tco_1532251 [Tanacetum coccineum]
MLFKTPGLVESSSPKFDLFFDIKEHSEEEETTKIMTKTMEKYMSKTRGNYGLGVARPKINDKTHFELKGKFLKELRESTFSGSEHEDANEHIKKVLEIIVLFHILDVTQDQIMLRAFPMSLTRAASRWLINEPLDMTPLPSRDQRHPWLRYQVEEYGEDIVHNYKQRPETIWGRSVNWVQVLDFASLTEGIRQILGDRLSMVYIGDEGQDLFTSHVWRRLFEIRAPLLGGVRRRMTWRQFILALGLHSEEEMAEVGFGAYWHEGLLTHPYLLARYMFRHAKGRKSGARLSSGHFITRLATHFRLVSDQGLRGLSVVTNELPLIDLHKLGRLNIYLRVSDTWAWVASGLKRQPNDAAGAPGAAEDAPADDEGAQVNPAPVQAP